MFAGRIAMLKVSVGRNAFSASIALLALQICFSPQAWPQTGGPRVANTTLRLPLEPPIAGYQVTNAFGALTFQNPVCIKSPPGETNRLFVVERTGRIMVITNLAAPNKTVFLDLSTNTYSGYLEAGLLGLAFHPGFATNRYLYVFRTAFTTTAGATNQIHDVLSRFEASPDNPNLALPGSELHLIAQYDDSMEHNAGDLAFGPNGYLYVSFGDESPPPRDQSDDPQAIDKGFFGGIVRLDVDMRAGSLPPNPHPSSTTNYAIPPDNPFIGATSHNGFSINPGQVRTEFYAVGFRNPWRMAFDPPSGDLYCGDVGASDWEEINLIVRGGNYGWPYREGPAIWRDPPPDSRFIAPLHAYPHGSSGDRGRCVIGGLVYRGAQFPELNAAYIFGDYISGSIWALHYDGTHVSAPQWLAADPGISAFGIDPRNGEILIADHDKGEILSLIYIPPEQAAPFPATLMDTGIFSDLTTLTPQPGVLGYEINVPFWSDNALKSRWFSVPDTNSYIDFNPTTPWTFPTGTVWIKHFDLELTNGVPESARRLETRVLVKNSDGIYGVVYRWNDDQTDAVLVPAQGMDETFSIHDVGAVRDQVWHYPSRVECLLCHTRNAGFALGFNTPQLTRDITIEGGPVHQIDHLSRMGYFSKMVTNLSLLRPLASATNTDYPIGYRVHSYLTANCVQCHNDQPIGAAWDARFNIRLDEAGIINGVPLTSTDGDPIYKIVKPNSLANSVLYVRVDQRGRGQMPPLATTLIDSNAVALLSEWITTFPPDPWQSVDIGNVSQEGFSSLKRGTFLISGAGTGFDGVADKFHFLHQTLRGSVQMAARIEAFTNAPSTGVAGVMLRAGTEPDAPFAMLGIGPTGEITFRIRSTKGAASNVAVVGTSDSQGTSLHLVQENGMVTAYVSRDGQQWSVVGQQVLALGPSISAGLAVASGSTTELATGQFGSVQALCVTIESLAEAMPVAPANIPLLVTVLGDTNSLDSIRFIADGGEVGAVAGPPFTWFWTNVPAGQYLLHAQVRDSSGLTMDSSPLEISVGLGAAIARFNGEDTATRGDWIGSYGADGYLISGVSSRPPAYAVPVLSGGDSFIWAERTPDERALRYLDSPDRIAAAWYSTTNLTIDISINDGRLHQIGLYFLDWDGNDLRSQTVEVRDAARGEILDTQTVTAFSSGKYLSWQMRGHVRLTISGNRVANIVLSGLFFDPATNAPPQVTLSTVPGPVLQLPGDLTLVADATDPDGQVIYVDMLANGTRLARLTNAPFIYLWTNAVVGTYTLAARAVDDLGEANSSPPLLVDAVLPQGNARFLEATSDFQGDWIGRYGFDGFVIAGHATNYPAFVAASSPSLRTFIWAQPTMAAAALLQTNLADRIAACWVDYDALEWEFEFKDGKEHKLSLYFLDFDGNGARQGSVDLFNAADGAPLDHQEVAGYSDGKYMSWTVRGRIQLRVTRQTLNAVVSAIFFDPLAATYPPPSLAITPPPPDNTSDLELLLRGEPNRLYGLEFSKDLHDWYRVQLFLTPPSGTVQVAPFDGEKAEHLFFRAVLLP
jgi:glucose/arabinose dehydrogenase